MQEFNSIEAAKALMDTEARDSLSLNGKLLTLDYSISQHASRGGTDASNLADWICTMCQAVNFSRSLQARCSRAEGLSTHRSQMHLHDLKCLDREALCADGWSAISAAPSVRLTRSE